VLPPTRPDHQNLHLFSSHPSRILRQRIGKMRFARHPDGVKRSEGIYGLTGRPQFQT
jgi:hypothetical protein